jgi:hypothetical protein
MLNLNFGFRQQIELSSAITDSIRRSHYARGDVASAISTNHVVHIHFGQDNTANHVDEMTAALDTEFSEGNRMTNKLFILLFDPLMQRNALCTNVLSKLVR